MNALYVAMTRAVQTLTLVESDTGHPLLRLLSLAAGEVRSSVAQASTREEWAQEARKLELQGKEEQARAIKETFLQGKPVPWTPWGRAFIEDLAPKALDRHNPSSKQKQALLDYALWHGQQTWVEQLALAGFQPARSLAPAGEFARVDTPVRLANPQASQNLQHQVRRVLAVARQRHLQPYLGKSFKELLRLCDVHGVDHPTPAGATPLMTAARAGNPALIDALLARGADPAIEDEFGHTAWQHAVNRALGDGSFAKESLAAVFDRLAPGAPGGGFHPEQMERVLDNLPAHLWHEKRRKRSYINQVLARAEVESSYRPARKLWVRTRIGHYLPNPAMQSRKGEAWQLVYEALALDWVDRGTGSDGRLTTRPRDVVARLAQRLAGTQAEAA